MTRRRLTLKRIDPWSVLKFGFVANLAFLAISLLGLAIVWFFVQRLGLIDKVCTMASDLAFENCGVDGGNLFRAAFLLGLLGTVVQTGIWVFLAFLYNLIADLVGGLGFTYVDETGALTAGGHPRAEERDRSTAATAAEPKARQQRTSEPERSRVQPPPPSGWRSRSGSDEERMFDRDGTGATMPVSGHRDTGGASPSSGSRGEGPPPS